MNNIEQQGVISTDKIVENTVNNIKSSYYDNVGENLYQNTIKIYTDKDGSFIQDNHYTAISAATLKSLAGKTICLSYDVCAPGDRHSNTNYGLRGDCTIDSVKYYPFSSGLLYSGEAKRFYETWKVPMGNSFSSLTLAIFAYDRPASTNNRLWFIKNVKIEVGNTPSPYLDYETDLGGYAVAATNLIEW